MVRYCLIALCVLWAGILAAQDNSVRSGEHDRFTRLVLPIPVGAGWALNRAQDHYVFSIPEDSQEFDLTEAFARIPRTRIADIEPTQDGAALAIFVSCADCHADAFLWRPDRVVIDIIDGAAPDGSPFEVAVNVLPTDPPTTPKADETPDSIAIPLIVDAPTPAALPLIAEQAPVLDVAATEQALIESLARASSQGLIEIALQPQDPRAETPDPQPTQEPAIVEEISPVKDAAPVSEGGQPGISMRTTFDQAFPHITVTPRSDQGETCLDEGVFDLASWSETGDFNVDIGTQRTGLTEEFDRVPPNAPEGLARSYIYYGFGREALQALALDGIRSKSREVLAEMAVVVDGGSVPNGLLSAQLGCDGAGALWAVLAINSLSEQPVGVDRNSVLLTHRSLPVGLRGHLGTTLAARFLDIDDTDTAAMILQLAEHAVTGSDAETDLVAADLAQRDGEDSAAIARLREAAGVNGRATPEGLMELVDLTIKQDQMFDQGVLDLIAAVRFEHRNSSVATDLGIAEARALNHSGKIIQALSVVTELSDDLDSEMRTALQSEFTMRAVEAMSDAAFLQFAFEDMTTDVDAETENMTAMRLLALGFPDRAAQLLLADATQDAMRERRYLRASAYIALEKPEEALREITGMTDPRASRLRADALIARGDLGGAMAADQRQTPDEQADPDLAWRAGAWARLADDPDPLLRDVSQRMLGDTETATPAIVSPLAQREELLQQSGETRALVQDLLDRFPIDAGDIATPIN